MASASKASCRVLQIMRPRRIWQQEKGYRHSLYAMTGPQSRFPLRSNTKLLPISCYRFASTSQENSEHTSSISTKTGNLVVGAAISALLVLGYYYVTDTRAGIHQWAVVPAFRWIYDDAEEAHHAGTKVLKVLYDLGIHPRERGQLDRAGDLQVEVFGHTLCNPIGTSAGIDKHAEIPTPLLALGGSIVEVGGATPYPQDGNPKPRVFRLPSQKALINRYGLNSEGADSMSMRLRQRVREYAFAMGYGLDEVAEQRVLDGEAGVPPGSLVEGKLMAVQVAKNKFTPDGDIEAVKRDYVYCVEALSRYADIIVVNVSSPNTPGLRDLQRVEPLTNILKGVVEAAARVDRKDRPAVMVKVSPDEDSDEQIQGIVDAICDSGVDGVIVGNTTNRRPEPLPLGSKLSKIETATLLEQGGYSGPQLFQRTLSLVKRYRILLDKRTYRISSYSHESAMDIPEGSNHGEVSKKIDNGIQQDTVNLKEPDEKTESESQPLRLPEPDLSSYIGVSSQEPPALPVSQHAVQSQSESTTSPNIRSLKSGSSVLQPKVIFATGGITNGEEALEVLNAGASVAMIYTALVYGGVGKISEIKREMRAQMRKQSR